METEINDGTDMHILHYLSPFDRLRLLLDARAPRRPSPSLTLAPCGRFAVVVVDRWIKLISSSHSFPMSLLILTPLSPFRCGES